MTRRPRQRSDPTTAGAFSGPERRREAPGAAGPPVDPGRLARALALEVSGAGPDRYHVSGGSAPHTVTTARAPWTCDCADTTARPGTRCKHVLAVYLHRQIAGPVRAALRELGQDRHPALEVVCVGCGTVTQGRPGAPCPACGAGRLTLAGGGA